LYGVARLPDLPSPQTTRGVCTRGPTRRSRMMCITGDDELDDECFIQAIGYTMKYMVINGYEKYDCGGESERPSLSPCVPFVGAPPRLPPKV